MRKQIILWTAVFLLLFGTACGSVSKGNTELSITPSATETVKLTDIPTPSPVPEADKSIYMDSSRSLQERVDALLDQMTLQEKIAQMVQPEQNESSGGASPEDVKRYGIGSVLSGGGSAPAAGNSAKDWQDRVLSYLEAARETRLGIPLLYGVDAVHGHNNVTDAVVFPHNIALGAAGDEALAERIGQVVAVEMCATGIRWTFAPTVGLPFNERWGRTYECFGETKDLVSRIGAAYVRGFQGVEADAGFLKGNTVIATAKHYIGEGQTENGINQGNVTMEQPEFETLLYSDLLEPYKAAISAGARSVMVSYNSVAGMKCHENKLLITDVLKGELGFSGMVVSDYNGIDQVAGATYSEKVKACVNAGIDVFMEPYDWKNFMSTLEKLVKSGEVSQERIDDAVRRILKVKFEMGLFDETMEEVKKSAETALQAFGSEEHREVAREAVRKSMVLLKNEDSSVWETLKKADSILVAGKKADDIGAQCGGWTISWQGAMGDIPGGTSILEAVKEAAGETKNITFSARGTVPETADAVIVVVGEEPYAETNGDRSAGKLVLSEEDKYVLRHIEETMSEQGMDIPVVMILLSGRPLTIAEELNMADAVVAAWLPGTEGTGVADVLLGDYDFTGVLSYTWPWYAADIDYKFTDESKVLFKRGTGLKKDGSSITEEGTAVIGDAPEAPEELQEFNGTEIDLCDVGYRVEAEWMNNDSYLVETGTENDITYVGNWEGQWANTKWNVYVSEPGSYRLHFVYAAEKNTEGVAVYYASPYITDDGNANRTTIPFQKTDNGNYKESTLDVTLEAGLYEFKLMSGVTGVKLKLDYVYFEPLNVEEKIEKEEVSLEIKSQGNLLAEDAVVSYATAENKPGDGIWYQQELTKTFFLTERSPLDITEPDAQNVTTITLNPESIYQTMLGVGTSLEESTIHHLKQLEPEVRREFIRYLLDPINGAGMTLFRLTIGTADFTAEPFYTYYDAGELDETNSLNGVPDWYNVTGNGFSVQKDIDLQIVAIIQEIIDVAKELGVENDIRFFASSWTPPGWMKKQTANSRSYKNNNLLLKGGKLAEEHIEDLAMYYVRYLEEYKKLGITITAITLQNEPMLEIDYPSCKMTATQEGKLAVIIREKLAQSELLKEEKLFLWAYDHNPAAAVSFTKELLAVEGAMEAINGIAFHDYSDPISAMSDVLNTVLSEGQTVALTERSVWGTSGADRMIQYFRNGAISYNAWVTMLDSKIQSHQWVGTPGPTLFVRDWNSTTDYWATPEVGLVGQFAKFIRPGDVRIESDYGSVDTVTSVAYKKSDGSAMVVICVNQTKSPQPLKLVWNHQQVLDVVPEKQVVTYIIPLETNCTIDR